MTDPAGEALPSLEEMRDTLQYMWSVFLEDLKAGWDRQPGAPLRRDWNGAVVEMTLTAHGTADATHYLARLIVDGPEGAFRLTGTLSTDPDFARGLPEVQWSMTGDHEELCDWMVPWVMKHVAEGGGYIEI